MLDNRIECRIRREPVNFNWRYKFEYKKGCPFGSLFYYLNCTAVYYPFFFSNAFIKSTSVLIPSVGMAL
jgi:hypothetical protein